MNKPKLKDLKAQALNFGVTAFKSGLKSVPHHDIEFNKFLNSGLVPEGRRILMYKAWAKGWHGMNASTNGGV